MIITVVLVVLVLAAVGYVLVSRMQGRPVNTRRLLVLPAVLTAVGALQLAGAMSTGFRPVDAGLLAVGMLAAAGLGAARGATVAVFVRDGRLWLQYRPSTLMLWAATVAVRVGLTLLAHTTAAAVAASGPALLLTVGITLFAEGAVIAGRAYPTGRPVVAGSVAEKHTALH